MKLETTPEFKVKKETKKEESNSSSVGGFISCLFSMARVLHIKHLQEKGAGSYARHKALGFYDKLHDFADDLAESYQGYHGKLITSYPKMDESKFDSMSSLDTVKWLLDYVEEYRTVFGSNSMLQNQIDELVKEISSTKYKLTFLE